LLLVLPACFARQFCRSITSYKQDDKAVFSGFESRNHGKNVNSELNKIA